MEKLMNTNTNI